MLDKEVHLAEKDNSSIPVARWAGNVALRFEVYDYAEPEFDIYRAIYERLNLSGDELVVDVGSNDGKFVYLLSKKMNEGNFHGSNIKPKGQVVGVEPNAVALRPLKYRNSRRVKFYKGSSENLGGADNSVDIVTANMVLYFAKDPEAALKEFLRVLKIYGKLAISTSGYFNKSRQRIFQHLVGQRAGSNEPELMNRSFDTDIATETLPKYFAHIYHGSYHGKMIFRSEDEALAYYHSMLSMGEFYDPPLSDEEMNDAYREIIEPIVQQEIGALGYFEDYIQRDFFICSNDPAGLMIYDPLDDDFKFIFGYHREELGACFGTRLE